MSEEFTRYKLIVLFLLHNSGTRLTNSQISELTLEDEDANYFHLQQAISELVDNGLTEKHTIANSTFYAITEDGSETLSYFEEQLPVSLRAQLLENLKSSGFSVPSRILTPAEYYPGGQGAWFIRCQIIEKNTSLMDLSMQVPSEEAARSICRSWPLKCQDIYAKIMEELL